MSVQLEETNARDADAGAPDSGGRGPFQELLKGTSLYGVGMIAQQAMGFVLLPLYTRCLSRADYGVLELLDLATSIAGLLLSARLGQSLFYYYFHSEDESERGRYITTALLGAVSLGAAIGATGVCLATPLSRLLFGGPEYADLVRINFLAFAAEPAVAVGFCYLRVLNRAGTFVAVSLVRLIANVLLNVLFLVGLGLGPASLLWSRLVSVTGLLIFLGWAILSAHRLSFYATAFRRLALYSLPLCISGAGDFFLHFGDRIFLRGAVSLSDLGLYALAYKLGMVVPFLSWPFFNYWNAQMVGLIRRPQGPYVYARVATYLLLGLTAVVLSLIVFIRPVVAIMAASQFRGAADLVPWLALAYLFRGMGAYWSNTFLIEGRPALLARTTWAGAGACVLAYALLIPRYRLWGAVAATLLGFAVMAAFAFWKSQRLRPFRYEYGRWAKIVACAAAATVPSALLRPAGLWPQAILGLACLGLFAMLLGLARFATEGELRMASRILGSMLRLGRRSL